MHISLLYNNRIFNRLTILCGLSSDIVLFYTPFHVPTYSLQPNWIRFLYSANLLRIRTVVRGWTLITWLFRFIVSFCPCLLLCSGSLQLHFFISILKRKLSNFLINFVMNNKGKRKFPKAYSVKSYEKF